MFTRLANDSDNIQREADTIVICTLFWLGRAELQLLVVIENCKLHILIKILCFQVTVIPCWVICGCEFHYYLYYYVIPDIIPIPIMAINFKFYVFPLICVLCSSQCIGGKYYVESRAQSSNYSSHLWRWYCTKTECPGWFEGNFSWFSRVQWAGGSDSPVTSPLCHI